MAAKRIGTTKGNRPSLKLEPEIDLASIASKLDKLLENDEKKTNEMKEMLTLVRQMQEELRKKDLIITKLQNELDGSQQYQRINNLIISGIPQYEREDTDEIVMQLGRAIGVDIEKRDIDVSHRLQRNAKNQVPIIVKFVRRTKKIEILKNRRKLKEINSSHIVKGSKNEKIYINEHLTKTNQTLFISARKLREENIIADTWVRDCKIWIRQTEESQAKQIANAEDLDLLRLGSGWERKTRRKN